MKTIYKTSTLIIALALILSSCSKDDENVTKSALVTFLKGKVEASTPATKTQHEYSDKTLKVRWCPGDQIAISDGTNIFKFTQTGELTDDGHTAFFSTENGVSLKSGEAIAIYPYNSNLTYDLSSQTGNITDVASKDILKAVFNISRDKIEDMEFKPICAIFKIPDDIILEDIDYSGTLKATFKGENVGSKVIFKKDGALTIAPGDITVDIDILDGSPKNNVFIAFVPLSETGKHSYSITLSNGESFDFELDNISTSKIYSIVSSFDKANEGFVVFKDPYFKNYCVESFDLDGDGEINFKEARFIKEISIPKEYVNIIVSLEGIEYFKNLEKILCLGRGRSSGYSARLKKLDIRKNHKLKSIQCLYCTNDLDIYISDSLCIENIDLSCSNANLYGYSSSLKRLSVIDCSFTVRPYSQSSGIDIWNNYNIDFRQFGSIESLALYSSTIKGMPDTLNVSGCGHLEALTLKGINCTGINADDCVSLQNLFCVETATVKFIKLKGDDNLKTIDCSDCTDLDDLLLSDCKKLISLNCNNCQISSLDIRGCASLKSLSLSGNLLPSLDVSGLTALTDLTIKSENLKTLNVRGCVSLTTLAFSNSKVASIDLGDCINLTKLWCYHTEIATLNITQNLILKTLVAWSSVSTGKLKTLYKKKGQNVNYFSYSISQGNQSCDPTQFGTEIIEVD